MHDSNPHGEYRCPGQDYPISRAVHLARMAGFYPGCRACRHGTDTGGLSRRTVRRVEETRARARENADKASLFFDEGAAGAYLNDIGPSQARRMAAALGVVLREAREQEAVEPPVAIVAGDGRPLVPELVAAVAEGLRWSGCHVVDIGQASAPSAAFALGHFEADGGILVGNPGRGPQTVGLKFWGGRGMPLSLEAGSAAAEKGSPSLHDVRRIYEAAPGRPCRKYGSLRHLQVEEDYLATLADHYHALRPLRLLLDCGCRPLVEHLQRLTEPLACEIIHHAVASDWANESFLQRVVRENRAHLAVSIEGDGETCTVFDERGETVQAERLTALIGRHLLAQIDNGTVVLERGGSEKTQDNLLQAADKVRTCGPLRAQMARAMQQSSAVFGGGAGGCFWYATPSGPLADGLLTLTLLLEILSQSDRPLSSVLDG